MRGGQDLDDSDEPLFVERFANENDFAVALHEGGIVGVAQEANDQDNDNDNENRNTNEYANDTPGIALENAAARREISGVPPGKYVELLGLAPQENPVELTGVDPPENKVDDVVLPTLMLSDYDSNCESDDKDEDIDTSAQKRQRAIHTEAMPPTVRNLYNLRLWKKNDYVRQKTDQSLLFAQVGNDLNEDSLW